MGTNFYTLKGKHIGKRSAAGSYCWDCNRTLCLLGNEYVHYSNMKSKDPYAEDKEVEWLDKCPICGKKKKNEKLFEGTVGRELGFNKEPFERKTDVSTCSSFSWAMMERDAFKYKFVKDEYGRKFTMKEFKEMLIECPIQFHGLIGREFS